MLLVRRLMLGVFGALAAACGVATLFFGFYGILVIYDSLTFKGEGSLGHVGMYIAAFLFPVLAIVFAGATHIAWRQFRRRRL